MQLVIAPYYAVYSEPGRASATSWKRICCTFLMQGGLPLVSWCLKYHIGVKRLCEYSQKKVERGLLFSSNILIFVSFLGNGVSRINAYDISWASLISKQRRRFFFKFLWPSQNICTWNQMFRRVENAPTGNISTHCGCLASSKAWRQLPIKCVL